MCGNIYQAERAKAKISSLGIRKALSLNDVKKNLNNSIKMLCC